MLLDKAATLPTNMELVAGGNANEDVFTSQNRSVEHISNHQKADTRIILHARDASSEGYKRIVVRSSDMHVLVLLIYQDIDGEAQLWDSQETTLPSRVHYQMWIKS